MDENLGKLFETPGQAGRAPVGRRVLAVRGGALGDFILTLPSLAGLRAAGFEVELLTRPAYGRLALDFEVVSGWRALDSPAAALLVVDGAEIDPAWRQWLSGFDAVVSWLPDPDGAFRRQVPSCGVAAFYQGDWRCGGEGPAAVQLAAALTGTGAAGQFPFRLFRKGQGPRPDREKVIAFHPGSGSARKNWPLEHWLEVMQHLQRQEPELSWLVITGEAEEERLAEFSDRFDQSGLPWESAHGLGLSQLAHRLRECRAFLGHDSGTSHLAAACGVPCYLLFGPTDPAVWAPDGENVRVIKAPEGDFLKLTPEAVLAVIRQK